MTRAAEIAAYWEASLHSLRHSPNVIDIRNLGLVGAVELASREGATGTRAYEVFLDCLARGLLVRVTGDIIALSPPLIIGHREIDDLVAILGDALARIS